MNEQKAAAHTDRKFLVRVARAEELEAAGRIARDAYLLDGMIEGDNAYADMLADAATRAAAPGVDVLVAVATTGPQAGTVAGTITVAEAGSALADICLPGELELRMLGVDHAFRGRGLGEFLMWESVYLARKRGLTAVLSLVTGNDKAARLYQRMNFERVPSRDWDIPEIPELGTMLVYRAPPTASPGA